MYADISPDAIYQGDIIVNFNFIVPPLGEPTSLQQTKDSLNKVPLSKLTNAYSRGSESLIVNSFRTNGMIITQTCDIQRRKYISLCPVHPMINIENELAEEGFGKKRIRDFIDTLQKQKINYYFYLPEITVNKVKLEEGYADLQVINSVPTQNISNYQRLVTLSDKGRHWLDYKLMNLFGRPFE